MQNKSPEIYMQLCIKVVLNIHNEYALTFSTLFHLPVIAADCHIFFGVHKCNRERQ